MNPAEFANIARHEESLWWYRGMRDILFRLTDPHLAGRTINRVLEAGCGAGYLARILQRERRLPVIAMDYSREGLRFARDFGVDRTAQADLLHIPFPSAAFDLIFNIDVLQQLPRGLELQAAAELARVLRPGGLLAIRVSALDALRSRHSQFVHEQQRFTRARLTALFTEHGIRPLRVTYANSLLFPVALAKFRVWEPLTARRVESGIQSPSPLVDSLLYRALRAEASWIAAGHDLPIGQSLFFLGDKPQTIAPKAGRP
jgi:SAM-dependent methyltransferase